MILEAALIFKLLMEMVAELMKVMKEKYTEKFFEASACKKLPMKIAQIEIKERNGNAVKKILIG